MQSRTPRWMNEEGWPQRRTRDYPYFVQMVEAGTLSNDGSRGPQLCVWLRVVVYVKVITSMGPFNMIRSRWSLSTVLFALIMILRKILEVWKLVYWSLMKILCNNYAKLFLILLKLAIDSFFALAVFYTWLCAKVQSSCKVTHFLLDLMLFCTVAAVCNQLCLQVYT